MLRVASQGIVSGRSWQGPAGLYGTNNDVIVLPGLAQESLGISRCTGLLTGKQTDFAPVWASFHARAASPQGHLD
jgi:hypothetical protein